jgi:steroid 5-alpha reductase family enzyme
MGSNFWIIALAIWTYVSLAFLFAVQFKRNDIADVLWGGGIFLASAFAITASEHSPHSNPIAYLLCGLVLIWSLRLTWQIGSRFNAKNSEDFRYAAWRRTWKYFYFRSYLQVFLLQGTLMIAVSAVVPAALMAYDPTDYNGYIVALGIVIFAVGLTCEAVADLQLNAFVKVRRDKDQILMTGLWKYSRHPNYFGEVTVWWGLYVIVTALAVQPNTIANIPMLLFALTSPATITYLLLKVSGIPALEAKYLGNAAFHDYKQRTSAFFPWVPQKPTANQSII